MRRSVASIVVLAMVVLGGVTSPSAARSLHRLETSGSASVPGPAEVIYSNFGPDMAFDANHRWTINGYQGPNIGQQAISQQFTPSWDYTFGNAQVAVVLDQGPNSLNVFLQADSAGLPGAVIEEIPIGGLGSTPAVVTATSALSPTLYRDTPYWLTLVAEDDYVMAGWNWNLVGDVSATTYAGSQGGSAAGPWSVGWLATRSAFQINGTPLNGTPPTPTPQPTVASLTPAPQPTATPPTPTLQSSIYLPLVQRPPYRVAFLSLRDGRMDIHVMYADGSGETNLTKNARDDYNPAWSPDGRQIAFRSDNDFWGWDSDIYVVNVDGSNPTRLTSSPARDGGAAWSPDGRKIAFYSSRDGNVEIYVMNTDGSNQTNLTRNSAYDAVAAWSPDGRKIAFYSSRDGNYEIYAMNADGSQQTRLTTNPGSDYGQVWSPDGRKIAFMSNRDGNWEIYTMNADGSNQTNLTNNPADDTSLALSPDGNRIAFVSNRDRHHEIYAMNADGSQQTRLTNDAGDYQWLDWSPDGRQIAFSVSYEIYMMDADGSHLTNLTNSPVADYEPVWSPR